MPSKGRAEWNKTYYAENCDDILYRKKVNYKKAETIKCKCGDRSQYKDIASSRNAHFKTLTHKVWEKKQDIYGMMTKQLNHSQLKAEKFIEERLEKKRARTPKDEMKVLLTIINECVDAIDGKNKPKKPEPVNVVVEEEKPIEEDKPYVPPSASFDPLALMGTANSDMDGL
jgi:hypothetical protein